MQLGEEVGWQTGEGPVAGMGGASEAGGPTGGGPCEAGRRGPLPPTHK